jgi:hypothetical protein
MDMAVGTPGVVTAEQLSRSPLLAHLAGLEASDFSRKLPFEACDIQLWQDYVSRGPDAMKSRGRGDVLKLWQVNLR